jgi:hypothetical protein
MLFVLDYLSPDQPVSGGDRLVHHFAGRATPYLDKAGDLVE